MLLGLLRASASTVAAGRAWRRSSTDTCPCAGGLTTPAMWPEPDSTKSTGPPKNLRAEEHRLRRRDVVLAGGEIVDRDLHLLEVELARRRSSISPLRQRVLEIAVAQIEGVVGGRHPRRIRIPVQQVERAAAPCRLQIVVDDVGPDQVVRAQHVEGGRHLACLRDSRARSSRSSSAGDLLLVDEHLQVAGIGEIDLGGEEGRRLDAVVAFAAI